MSNVISTSDYLNNQIKELDEKRKELENQKDELQRYKKNIIKAYECGEMEPDVYKHELIQSNQLISDIYSKLAGISNEIIAITKMTIYLQ